MRRRIGADPLEARQIGRGRGAPRRPAVRGDDAVVEHAARRGDHRRGAEPELGALAQPDLAVIEQPPRGRKGAAARLGDQRGAHAQRRRPARVDRQHGLDEILVERRAAQDAAAARRDQRRLVGRGVAQRGDRRRRVPIRRKPASDAAQQLGHGRSRQSRRRRRRELRGSRCVDRDGPERSPIRSVRARRGGRRSHCHGASCAQPWLMTVRRRSIGQRKASAVSPPRGSLLLLRHWGGGRGDESRRAEGRSRPLTLPSRPMGGEAFSGE